MRFKLFFLFLFFPGLIWAQKSTISGYVKEAASGEGLIGASVYVKELKTGNVTNTYGFYSLTLPLGKYILVFSSSGFKKLEREIQVSAKSQELSVELSTDARELAEVIVKARANDENVTGIEMSVNKVDMKTIRKIPALLGEIEMLAAFAVRLIWLLNCFFNCEFNSLIAASFVFPPISIPATRTPLGIPEPTASHATNQIRERAPTEIVEIIAI